MEKCNITPLNLTRYLQNKMTREEETDFQQHLDNCPGCREQLERMRIAIREIEQEGGSKKAWIIAVAIACSVAGGIYFLPRNQPLPEKHPFELNHPHSYNDVDSTLINDTLFRDTLEREMETIIIE